MLKFLGSINWFGVAAAMMFIGVSIGTAILVTQKSQPTLHLPLIKDVNLPTGFTGKHAFGLWTLVCQDLQPGSNPADPAARRLCRTNARMLVRGPNNQPVLAAGFNIVRMDTQPKPGIVFVLPLGARAAATANFAIDKNTAFKAPIRCTQRECLVQGALPDEALEQMRNGITLSLIYTVKDKAQKDRKVRVDQLLHGFRQSYDAMVKAVAA
ncbi:MAG: invasion associated locus B family protein [Alphaproteobacteria bacterium]|nr:invasion associated locus B family protein [Alphaproteobacteria bacterium]